MTLFDLTLVTRASLHPDGEPSAYVTSYDGRIRASDDRGRERAVGRVVAHRVHAGLAANDGESLFDVCDSHSDDLHRLHALLYEPNGYGFRSGLQRRFEAYELDLLVLDYVVLAPRWRGLRVGLLAARKLVDLVGGGCGLVVADIAPLNPEASEQLRVPERWLPATASEAVRRAGAVKLRRHFRRMGFERLGRTRYYALPTALDIPTASDLLGRPDRGTPD